MENIREKITALNIYPEENINMLVDKIELTDKEVYSAIELWLRAGAETNITIAGISYVDLADRCEMNPIAAYLTLDWIKRNPEEAVKTLRKEYSGLL